MFIEKVQDQMSLVIYSKDKCSIDLEGKELIIFLLEVPESYSKDEEEI